VANKLIIISCYTVKWSRTVELHLRPEFIELQQSATLFWYVCRVLFMFFLVKLVLFSFIRYHRFFIQNCVIHVNMCRN